MESDRPAKPTPESRWEWLCLALLITVAYVLVPRWIGNWIFQSPWSRKWSPDVLGGVDCLAALGIGLLLALSSPRRSGLQFGRLRESVRGTVLVCVIPIILAAIVLPLSNNPFAGNHWCVWLISPLAQDLVFIGYLYGRLDLVFPGFVHPRLPIRRGLLVAGVFFSGHHLIGLLDPTFSAGFLLFQLAYTFTGFVFVGLSRQWTGSLFYYTANHMIMNWMACTM